jgi:hypothetical protein
MSSKSLLAASLLSSLVSAQLSSVPAACRCLYGRSCWPNQAAFDILSQNLSRPLIYPTPVAAPCYADLSSSACANVQTHFSDAIWRTDQPGAHEFQNFESYTWPNGTIDACYLDTTLGSPCKQGSIPPIGVDARNTADIQAAIAFAKTHNLKLVIKNTGHDYQGRSIARGAFMLWTHNIKGMTYHSAFMPSGGPAGATYGGKPSIFLSGDSHCSSSFVAITTSAGDQWVDAYALALQHGRMLVGPFALGGSLGTAGGIAQGGGDGVWSPRHGLGKSPPFSSFFDPDIPFLSAVDNILQYTIVTASGGVLTANEYQNSTLFWALRGGGPGVFGVVTSVTYKTHPSFNLSYATFNADITDAAAAQTVVTRVVQDIIQFTDMGWGGYMYIIQPGSLRGVWVAPEVSQADLATTLDPFGTFLNETTGGKGGIHYNSSTSYYGWYDESYLGMSGSQVTGNIKIASRLMSKELAQSDPAAVVSKILAVDSLFKGFE